jgi:signal transduction histidine kinase
VMEMLEPGLRRTSCRIDLQVTVDPLLELDSYPGPLGQVLVNLVNNAVLHAFEGREQGRLIITAQALDAGWLRMEVADDGCGIATERLHRLFDAFYSSKFGQGSCGLGLHLVQDIVTQRLGGRIAVSSSPGQGCSFRFELPLQAPA